MFEKADLICAFRSSVFRSCSVCSVIKKAFTTECTEQRYRICEATEKRVFRQPLSLFWLDPQNIAADRNAHSGRNLHALAFGQFIAVDHRRIAAFIYHPIISLPVRVHGKVAAADLGIPRKRNIDRLRFGPAADRYLVLIDRNDILTHAISPDL